MSFDLGLTGRRALVTGGTKGIGAAVDGRYPPARPCDGSFIQIGLIQDRYGVLRVWPRRIVSSL